MTTEECLAEIKQWAQQSLLGLHAPDASDERWQEDNGKLEVLTELLSKLKEQGNG